VVKLIPEFCPETFIFKRNDINSGALEKFIRKNNRQKLLLKPGITSGGVGMEQIDYPSDVSTIKSFIDKAPHACQYQSSWMVQKCYEGELYSLEGFVLHDQITYLGFSHRIRQGYVEYSNEYPAQKQLTEPVKNSCFNAVSTLINRSNYRNGYFHCEFIIANGASYLIDANMGRIAGSAIIEQLAVAYEKLPEEILQHVFDVGLFGGKYSAGFSYVMLQDTMTMAVKYKALHDMDVVEVSFPQDLPIYHTRVFPNNDGWIGYLSGKKSDVDYALHKLTIHAKDNISDPYFVLGYKEGV
jgi:hypothetical protein